MDARGFLGLIVTFVFLVPGSGVAREGGPDTFGYRFVDSNEAWGPAYAYQDAGVNGVLHDTFTDLSNELVDIGFYFDFYGVAYSQLYIQSNGAISFDGGLLADSSGPLPVEVAPELLVAAFWDDLAPVPNYSSWFYTELVGTAPNRQFIIQWDGIPHASNANLAFGFQIILEESTDTILVQYQYVSAQDADVGYGGGASTGIQGGAAGYLQYTLWEQVIADNSAVLYRLCQPSDGDGDGYSDCEDCDDTDPTIYPGAVEGCNDGIDSNCDGVFDEINDQDGDGVSTCSGDCDDTDPLMDPFQAELCDGVDNDCDGLVDEDFGPDGDGDGWVECAGDCDDTDPTVYPGAPNLCDGLDNDCDGVVNGASDLDGDGYSVCAGDCDDLNAAIYPGAVEVCDLQDTDCDGVVPADETTDADGDGWMECEDCDDGDATVHIGALDTCNGVDDDCDGLVDEAYDEDGDGYAACTGDCDDTDPDTHPGAAELCDGIDNDCDGTPASYEQDQDGDGFLECDECDDTDPTVCPGCPEICDGQYNDCPGDGQDGSELDDDDGDGFSECGPDMLPHTGDEDCNDHDDTIYPGAPEACNDGIDSNCDGVMVEDVDNDGDSYSTCDGDCDDNNADTYEGAEELCDGRDNDCDGALGGEEIDDDGDGYDECVDGDCDDTDADAYPDAPEEPYDGIDQDCDGEDLVDVDGDGHQGGTNGHDCDDTHPAIFPGAREFCDDGVDNDCDGDVDGDDADCAEAPEGCDCSQAGGGPSPGSLWMLMGLTCWGLVRRFYFSRNRGTHDEKTL